MNLSRHLQTQLSDHFQIYKQALVLLGARQVGKTTLLKRIFPNADYLLLDNEETKRILDTYDINTYKQVLTANRQLIIDELHLLSDPGRAVKIIYDQIENIQIIVTGSSALHIKNKSSESLAGRKIEYCLFPLTFSEYLVQKEIEATLNFNVLDNVLNQKKQSMRLFSPRKLLSSVLLYGQYPETLSLSSPQKYLEELADSVLFKDILELNLIDNRSKAKELLKLLAYQIGNLVNYSEIGQKLSMDRRTVERYIEIFEQSFIIKRIYPFFKKKRNELSKTPKIFFYDLGLRNALIGNFDEINIRADAGAMFENFIIIELLKAIEYQNLDYRINYWRKKSGAEVDIVLTNTKNIYAVEVKLSQGQTSQAFKKDYPEAKDWVVTSNNFY